MVQLGDQMLLPPGDFCQRRHPLHQRQHRCALRGRDGGKVDGGGWLHGPELSQTSSKNSPNQADDSLCRSGRAGLQCLHLAPIEPSKRRGSGIPPSSEADESFPDEITICDPRHPLYGRAFRVIRRTSYRGGNFLPSFEVDFQDSVTLLVPVAATDPHVFSAGATKLSIDALLDLLNVVESCDHEHGARSSLDDAAADPSPTDRRRHCRSSGGGLSCCPNLSS